MKISTKGRYALRMLYDIALHAKDDTVSLTEVAERQHISKKYLEQIVPMLTRAGILRAVRGNRGGYSLAKKANVLSVGEVLRATEGNLAPVSCLEFEPNDCPMSNSCPTLFLWEGLFDAVKNYLDSITIQDIIDRSCGEAAALPGNDCCT